MEGDSISQAFIAIIWRLELPTNVVNVVKLKSAPSYPVGNRARLNSLRLIISAAIISHTCFEECGLCGSKISIPQFQELFEIRCR